MKLNIKDIQKFVGNITYDQIKDIDTFLCDNLALFIPSTGPCQYAITKDHTHPGYSFILLFDYYCKITVDEKEINSVPGLLAVFSPDIPHHETLTEKFTRYIAIIIDKSYFETQLNDYSIGKINIFKGDLFKSTNELRNYLKDFMIEYENELPGYKKILNAIGLNITHSLIRIIYKYQSSKNEISTRMDINNIIEYMHSNYNKKLTIKELSYHGALSSSHFSRIFKQETGKSPYDYLIYIRLEKAKKLLLNSNKSITDIAYDTGFNSSSHFTTYFTKYYQITPSGYKNKLLKKHNYC